MGSCTSITKKIIREIDVEALEDFLHNSQNSTQIYTSQNNFNNDLPDNIKWKDTIPFIEPIQFGQVIKVYDGDSITVASRLPIPNSPIYRFQVRLNGIDTPEIKGKTKDEKEMAQKAKKALSGLILNKEVKLKNVSKEKYGRLLADVYYSTNDRDICCNNWMIKQRYAVPYNGGTKKIIKSWKKYKQTGKY